MNYKRIADKMIFKAMSDSLIRSIMKRLERADAYTFWHSISVTRMSLVLGLTYGLDEKTLKDLMYAALFHEIGMVEATNEFYRDKAPLTMNPKEKVLRHPIIGAAMIENLGCFSKDVISAIRCHHENFDGSGVSYHNPGEKANLLARIIRICDLYDTLADDHEYTSKLIRNRILNVITASRGKELDPDMVSLFLFVKDPGKIENQCPRRKHPLFVEDFQLYVS